MRGTSGARRDGVANASVVSTWHQPCATMAARASGRAACAPRSTRRGGINKDGTGRVLWLGLNCAGAFDVGGGRVVGGKKMRKR